MVKLRCSACGEAELSVETRLAIYYNATVAFSGVSGLIFSGPKVNADRARVCRNCGHVMIFLGSEARDKLDKVWDKLQPG
jgi:hypothetical protein